MDLIVQAIPNKYLSDTGSLSKILCNVFEHISPSLLLSIATFENAPI